jgi:hypothetical protein
VRASWELGGCRDFRCRENGHLSDDKTVAKMGHPVLVARLDVGHRSYEERQRRPNNSLGLRASVMAMPDSLHLAEVVEGDLAWP